MAGVQQQQVDTWVRQFLVAHSMPRACLLNLFVAFTAVVAQPANFIAFDVQSTGLFALCCFLCVQIASVLNARTPLTNAASGMMRK
jgi:hypothetical protein